MVRASCCKHLAASPASIFQVGDRDTDRSIVLDLPASYFMVAIWSINARLAVMANLPGDRKAFAERHGQCALTAPQRCCRW
jgi:hypothetical protein